MQDEKNNPTGPAGEDEQMAAIKARISEHDGFMANPVEEIEVVEDPEMEEEFDDELEDLPDMEGESLEDDGEIHIGSKYQTSAKFICSSLDHVMCFIATLTGGDEYENYKKLIPDPEPGTERVDAMAEMLQQRGIALPPELRFALATGAAYAPVTTKIVKDRKKVKRNGQGL